MATTSFVDPVDERLPLVKLIPLGLQHVLVMYAGSVAVPLIVGRALNLPPEQIAVLVNADLFACGIATLIQSVGIGPFGIRLPIMMGVTFAAVAPMVAMANNPALGLGGILGSVIAAGIFGMIAAPFMSGLLRLFPPVVTGTTIAVIGISLMRVGINWAAGAAAPNLPGYGDPVNLLVAAFVLISILCITRFAKGFLANIAVLLGIILGFIVAWLIGKVNFAAFNNAAWLDLIYPFQLVTPRFDIFAIITMCLVMLVVMVESTGMFLAVGEMTGRKVDRQSLTRGLLTDGLGTPKYLRRSDADP
jgi:NCS2 family nucleobase:cation symporter-2